MRVLACVGDATSPEAWSGTPFHFLEAGRRLGFLDRGLALQPERLKFQRLLWNGLEFLRFGEVGGYQYSTHFLDRLMAQAPALVPDTEIISHHSLFPVVGRLSTPVSFYIDATQAQIFEEYGMASSVSKRMIAGALSREREQFAGAKFIVGMSRWVARSLVERYGVPPERVFVIPAGANIDEVEIDEPLLDGDHPLGLSPLRLGFIGVDWRRKNLPFLLEVADCLRRRGHDAMVEALGFPPESGPRHPLLHTHGYLHKRRDAKRFRAFLRSLHFGCLFSHAEAYGLSNVECLRLGVPVLTWNVGGLSDTLPGGMGHLFQAGATPSDVSDVVEQYLVDGDKYRRLRKVVRTRANELSWDVAVARFSDVWTGQVKDRFDRLLSLDS